MDKEKDENYDFIYIKNFSKMRVTHICKRLSIDPSNVLKGTASKENLARVRRAIENDLKELERQNLWQQK